MLSDKSPQSSTLLLVTHHSSLLLGLACSSLGGGGWPHSRQNIRLITEIFRGRFLDVIERDGVHVVLELLVVIEAEAVNLVERAMITERVVALVGDLLLSDQFLFGAL